MFAAATPVHAQEIDGGPVNMPRRLDRVDLGRSAILLDLDSEILFVPDEGTTEARLEAEARVELFAWLWADADFTLTRATFKDAAAGEAEILVAPRLSISGGISAVHPIGIFGRIGVLHLTDRPATEHGFITPEGFTRADFALGYHHELFEVTLDVENLLDADMREDTARVSVSMFF